MVLSSEFAALATLQNIVSAKKSFKDVVDDFIEFTIIYHHYKECDSAQIAKDLRSDFNFEIPISVIRNVLRSLHNKKFLTFIFLRLHVRFRQSIAAKRTCCTIIVYFFTAVSAKHKVPPLYQID